MIVVNVLGQESNLRGIRAWGWECEDCHAGRPVTGGPVEGLSARKSVKARQEAIDDAAHHAVHDHPGQPWTLGPDRLLVRR